MRRGISNSFFLSWVSPANIRLSVDVRRALFHHSVGLIYFDIAGFTAMERLYGRDLCRAILLRIKSYVSQRSNQIRHSILSHRMFGDDLFLFVRLPQTATAAALRNLEDVTDAILTELRAYIAQILTSKQMLSFHVGTAVIDKTAESLERHLYNAMKTAMYDAKSGRDFTGRMLRASFQEVLDTRAIYPVYQPIISLQTGTPHGYEALTRGQHRSFEGAPGPLFEMAKAEGKQFDLERIARNFAISQFAPFAPHGKLFLNVSASVVHDPSFTPHELTTLLESQALDPSQVVLEITERDPITDYHAFNHALSKFRDEGFDIAIDDAGAGYSSLQAIAQVRPTYIKVDQSLVENVHRDHIKSMMLETLVGFADKVRCRVIAEGIETEPDLKRLLQLGIEFGQGFLIGRPVQTRNLVGENIVELVQSRARDVLDSASNLLSISQLVTSVHTFDEQTPVSEVVAYFNGHEFETGVVITRRDKPCGLVMREKLFQKLAFKYGIALYFHRGVWNLMEENPLIVEANLTVEAASRMSMARSHDQVYDLLIVTQHQRLLGVVSIQSILDAMTDAQIQLARDANPLTGLPGNRLIAWEVARRVEAKQTVGSCYVRGNLTNEVLDAVDEPLPQ